MFSRILQILSFVFIVSFISCNDSGKEPTSIPGTQSPQTSKVGPIRSAPDPGIKYVGLWPRDNPYSNEIYQWKSCVNAKATIIPDGYQWPDGIRNSLNTAIENGYTLKLWRVATPINGNNAVLAILNDPTIGPNLTGLFIDEPFQNNWSDGQVLEVVGYCQNYGLFLAVSHPDLVLLERVRNLVAQNYPAWSGNIIYMPDKYFDTTMDEQTIFYNNVKNWAISNGISLSKIMPWVSPSCSFPGWPSAPGCSSNWTYSIISFHMQLGFGGVFIFPANGIDANHSAQMKTAFSENGWSQVNFGCGYPLTY